MSQFLVYCPDIKAYKSAYGPNPNYSANLEGDPGQHSTYDMDQ